MANVELEDTAQALQAKQTEHAVPVGWWLLFFGLIGWGVWYFVAYIGWDQAVELSGARTALATNIGHTIAYTAIPLTVVIALAVAMARRRRAGR